MEKHAKAKSMLDKFNKTMQEATSNIVYRIKDGFVPVCTTTIVKNIFL